PLVKKPRYQSDTIGEKTKRFSRFSASRISRPPLGAVQNRAPTPSGAIPPLNQPNAHCRNKKAGRKKNPPGHRRSQPNPIGRREEHHMALCLS
ncbi:MAG TPA: hypothetical protein PKV38_11825, partial [bacterium]|nr:hypothetical protein [bacterium]